MSDQQSNQQQVSEVNSPQSVSNPPNVNSVGSIDYSNVDPVFRLSSATTNQLSQPSSNQNQQSQPPSNQNQPPAEQNFQTVNFQIRRPANQPMTSSSVQQQSTQPVSYADKTKLNVQRQQMWNQIPAQVVDALHAPKQAHQSNQAVLSSRAKNYQCVLPDATIQYLIRRHGGEATDDVTARIVGIIAEKFAVDLLSDARTLSRSRGLDQINRTTKERRQILTKTLLREVAQERGIVFKN